jgi:hypothetical protein
MADLVRVIVVFWVSKIPIIILWPVAGDIRPVLAKHLGSCEVRYGIRVLLNHSGFHVTITRKNIFLAQSRGVPKQMDHCVHRLRNTFYNSIERTKHCKNRLHSQFNVRSTSHPLQAIESKGETCESLQPIVGQFFLQLFRQPKEVVGQITERVDGKLSHKGSTQPLLKIKRKITSKWDLINISSYSPYRRPETISIVYSRCWKSRTDVLEEGGNVRVEFELPGIDVENQWTDATDFVLSRGLACDCIGDSIATL